MTERQKFQVVKRVNGAEIRRYQSCMAADVLINAEYEKAGNLGFRPLVSYISQNSIAMTAPVLQEMKSPSTWMVSFVMPDGANLGNLPLPRNSHVSLRQVPEHYAIALSFSGFTSWNKVVEKEKELRNIIENERIEVTGAMQIARFDPPWKPGFLRHNEVVIPIKY